MVGDSQPALTRVFAEPVATNTGWVVYHEHVRDNSRVRVVAEALLDFFRCHECTVLPDPRPIILFKDGWATKDINYFVRGLDIPAHKMMYPKTWVEWQLVDDKVALKNSNGGFTKMTFQNRYEPNSSSLTFEQKFTRLLTGVNVALGTSAVVQKDIQFWNDHRVVVGSYTGVITPSTVTQVVPPESRGTYHIDGYTIELKWDDGTTKKTSFVWSDEDPEAVYIDGLAYIVFN